MDAEKAKELMAQAIQAMLDCGEYKAAHVVTARTMVQGQLENVTCLIFGNSADVLSVISSRVVDASIEEKIPPSSLTRQSLLPKVKTK